jgi:hypothetical protein
MMTTSTNTSTKPARALAFAAATGAVVAALLIAAAWLSPLALHDRRVLALLAVTVALPLGAGFARPVAGLPHAGLAAAGALVANLVMATVLTAVQPELWLHAAVWCTGAGLLGAGAGMALGRVGVLAGSVGWLVLSGLPFFYDRVPLPVLERWALEGAPWLGFSMAAFGGDPLRLPVIYMGKLSELTAHPAANLLSAGTIWLAATIALATAATKATALKAPTTKPLP